MEKDALFRKRGRPPKKINSEMVEKLASIGCTGDEIAAVLDCCRDTLYVRFSDSLKKGQNQAKATLRRLQWHSASCGNVTMQIWLGKNMLGQSNKHEIQTVDTQTIRIMHFGGTEAKQWEGKDIFIKE
jgi:hypothetical protein